MVKKEEKAKLIKIEYPPINEMPDDVYSNNVRITHGPDDFILNFAKIDPPSVLEGEEFKDDKIMAKIVARIRLTPSVAIALSRALSANIEKYKEKFKSDK